MYKDRHKILQKSSAVELFGITRFFQSPSIFGSEQRTAYTYNLHLHMAPPHCPRPVKGLRLELIMPGTSICAPQMYADTDPVSIRQNPPDCARTWARAFIC